MLKTSKVLNLLSSGDELIQLFEIAVLCFPNKENGREYINKLIDRINIAKQCKLN